MKQQSILVVDGETQMRKLLVNNLRARGYTVLAAVDGSEALRAIEEHNLDLVLLDINIPGPNGMQVLTAVRRSSGIPILILSGRGREFDKVAALDLGADDYLTKPFGMPELLARIKALLRRANPRPRGPDRSYHYQGLEVDFGARRALLNGVHVPLTSREFDVLAYFARNAGKILLHRQVLQAVWGGQYGDEAHYIWMVVARIRRKIEPDLKAPRYLLTEHGIGYRMPQADTDTGMTAWEDRPAPPENSSLAA